MSTYVDTNLFMYVPTYFHKFAPLPYYWQVL